MGERDYLEDIGVDERITLKWIFKKEAWTKFIWLRIGAGACECDNECTSSIKCGGLLD
jgi:hypothetical protein